MAAKTWIGGATAVVQVDTFTNTNTGGGSETWTWTVTLENGTTQTETFVDDGSATAAELYTGLVAAWNNSTKSGFTRVTAAGSTPVITLTADTAGIPFYAALTASGTGAYTKTSAIANVGPYDYNTGANWVEGSKPTTAENVRLTGSYKIIYGLDQSGVAIGGFETNGYSGTVGVAGSYLKIDPDGFSWSGTGAAYIDIGSAAIPVTVNGTATAATGSSGLYLLGTGITTLNISGGTVQVAKFSGETSTVATAQVSNGATLYLGSGLTLTTLHIANGTVELGCAATTVNADGGMLTTMGSGAITTVNNNGATIYPNSTGTVTTLNCKGGTTDFTKSKLARTVSTLNLYSGAKIVRDPSVVTVTTLVQSDYSTVTAA